MNQLAAENHPDGPTEERLQAIADSKSVGMVKRHAALRLLALIRKGAGEEFERLVDYTVGSPLKRQLNVQANATGELPPEELVALLQRMGSPEDRWPPRILAWYKRRPQAPTLE